MDVILHVGAHRTGTTTLQRFLNANREGLNRQGIEFWGPGKTRSGLFTGLVKAPNRITDEDLRRGHRASGLIQIELSRAEQAGVTDLIVSEENMIGSMENNINMRRLYAQTRPRLERFRDGFALQCRRILLTIRSYDRYWASSLGFYIKTGHGLPAPKVIDALAAQPIRWARIIREIGDCFPDAELVVSPFEGMVGLPEHQLTALLGREGRGPFLSRREWHNAGPDRSQLQQYLDDLGDLAPAVLQGGPGPWQPFSEPQLAIMRAAYAQDLAWLRAGADGLATYIESPEAADLIARQTEGETGQGRGPTYEQEHRRLG